MPISFISTQDDCIAVKAASPASENMLFERINASGVGMTIGSIGCDVVNNITFRDVYMHRTFKGRKEGISAQIKSISIAKSVTISKVSL